jgi:hypothetical protein
LVGESADEGVAGDAASPAGRSGWAKRLPLERLFEARTKPEVIGLFLAILELIKQRAVTVEPGPGHGEDEADVYVTLLPQDPNARLDGSDSTASGE